ncbi:MAG: hypothetical protein WAM79_01310 [Candidatus Sulfotelmatobacter sp.]
MAGILKSEASDSFIKAVQQVEDRADLCYQGLPLLTFPRNLGSWGILSRIILQIEETIGQYGYRSQTQTAVTYNLGRGGAQALAWVKNLGAPPTANRREFSITPALLQFSTSALWTAVGYEAFTTSFPLWHKDVLRAEVLQNGGVRFGSEDEPYLRVRAYLQGLRPAGDRPVAVDLGNDLEPAVKKTIQNIVENARGGQFSFTYPIPTRLCRQLFDRYYEASASQFRRDDALVLGNYTLGIFRKFYSALIAICSVHENACFVRAQLKKAYPANSAVMILTREDWIRFLSKISGLSKTDVSEILADLMFGATKTLDLYVHPFVSLDAKPELIGIVPHFPLKSRADENILRVCSYLRPKLYDAITSVKEDEMRKDLKAQAYSGFRIRGPRSLPDDLPDVDLVIEDTLSSTVVIAEMKWLRKTIRTVEQIQQRDLFLRGIEQMRQIKTFLQSNPGFLAERGDLTADLNKFQNVHYVVVPRDYFVWAEQSKDKIPVIDYEPFTRALSRETTLAQAMTQLLTLDWLPSKGRDFEIKFEPATANGAVVETEVIYARY